MIPTELSLMDFVYLVLFMLIFVLILYNMVGRSKLEKHRFDLEEKQNAVVKFKDFEAKKVENLTKKIDWLQQVLNDRLKTTIQKIQELEKKNEMLLEQKEFIMREVENRVGPMRASLNQARTELDKFQNSVNQAVADSQKELKHVNKEFTRFSKEIKKMKEAIRERTIDFEL